MHFRLPLGVPPIVFIPSGTYSLVANPPVMPSHRLLRLIRSIGLLTAAFVTLLSSVSPAQAPDGKAVTGSRAELLARSRAADSLGRKEEGFVLRTRLRDGDFEVGDKILITYEGPVDIAGPTRKRTDSLLVQAGKILRLDSPMGDVSLVGVLRSEIEDSVITRVTKYYKNVVVHVVPLLRLSVSGAVRLPGVYQSRPDTPLSDLIRLAGQDQMADPRNTIIKRGERTIWKPEDVASAIADGMTLDRLGLDPGDEVVLGVKRGNNWMTYVPYAASLITAILLQQLIKR